MRGLSFGFRDYAVHLFPGCLVISATLYLFDDLDWIDKDLAPLLAILFLFGGYIVGFFMDAIAAVLKKNPRVNRLYWRLSGGDCLNDYFKGVKLKGDPLSLKDHAAQILARNYGERFVRNQPFPDLMYLMMREVEARNETSAAFLSRINALENMATNMGFSCFWGALILVINALFNPDQAILSSGVAVMGVLMGKLLLVRKNKYRSWLAKSVLRVIVSLYSIERDVDEKQSKA